MPWAQYTLLIAHLLCWVIVCIAHGKTADKPATFNGWRSTVMLLIWVSLMYFAGGLSHIIGTP